MDKQSWMEFLPLAVVILVAVVALGMMVSPKVSSEDVVGKATLSSAKSVSTTSFQKSSTFQSGGYYGEEMTPEEYCAMGPPIEFGVDMDGREYTIWASDSNPDYKNPDGDELGFCGGPSLAAKIKHDQNVYVCEKPAVIKYSYSPDRPNGVGSFSLSAAGGSPQFQPASGEVAVDQWLEVPWGLSVEALKKKSDITKMEVDVSSQGQQGTSTTPSGFLGGNFNFKWPHESIDENNDCGGVVAVIGSGSEKIDSYVGNVKGTAMYKIGVQQGDRCGESASLIRINLQLSSLAGAYTGQDYADATSAQILECMGGSVDSETERRVRSTVESVFGSVSAGGLSGAVIAGDARGSHQGVINFQYSICGGKHIVNGQEVGSTGSGQADACAAMVAAFGLGDTDKIADFKTKRDALTNCCTYA